MNEGSNIPPNELPPPKRSRPVGTRDINPPEVETIGFDDSFIEEHTFGIDQVNNTLTLSFIHFLQDNGYDVYKMSGPVALFEGNGVTAKSFKLDNGVPMSENFQTILSTLQDDNATKVFVYVAMLKYMYMQTCDPETFEPTGEKTLTETRIMRMDWS